MSYRLLLNSKAILARNLMNSRMLSELPAKCSSPARISPHAHDVQHHEVDHDDQDRPDPGARAAEEQRQDHDRPDEQDAGDDHGFKSGRKLIEHGRVS